MPLDAGKMADFSSTQQGGVEGGVALQFVILSYWNRGRWAHPPLTYKLPVGKNPKV